MLSSYQNQNRINANDTEFINSIFINNGFAPIESQAQILKDKAKKTKTYESPIRLKRSEVKLEKDGLDSILYYITFKYSSTKPFNCKIYFNAAEDFSSSTALYKQSEAFTSINVINIENVVKGKDNTFFEKEAKLDMKYYQDNKIYDKLHHDIIIECTIYNNEKKSIECVLATYCKIIKVNDGNYKVRADIQKLKVKNTWFDMQDVYGLEDNDNSSCSSECEACYTNMKDTIFVPCMHSYACNDCAVYVRLKGNKCPLCRESKHITFVTNH